MKLANAWLSVFIIILLCGIPGCKKNIKDTKTFPPSPNTFSYNAPYSQTWNAVVEAVATFNAIDIIDPAGGFISTGLINVDGDKISTLDSNLSEVTVKFSYNIKLRSEPVGYTGVMVLVELFGKPGFAGADDEPSTTSATSVLRDHLFALICNKLFPPEMNSCEQSTGEGLLLSAQFSSGETDQKLKYDKRVFTAQKRLNGKGYKAGHADGLLGETTRKAIKYFQRDNSLPVRGELDRITYDLLTGKVSPNGREGKAGQIEVVKIKPAGFTKVAVPKHNLENRTVVTPAHTEEKDSQPTNAEDSAVPEKGEESFLSDLPIEGDSASPTQSETTEVKPTLKKPEEYNPLDQDTNAAKQVIIGIDSHSPVNPADAVKVNIQENEPETPAPPQQPLIVRADKYIIFETAYLLENQDLDSAKILDIIPEGTSITVLAETEGYFKVQYNGAEGYVHADFVNKQK